MSILQTTFPTLRTGISIFEPDQPAAWRLNVSELIVVFIRLHQETFLLLDKVKSDDTFPISVRQAA